MQAEPSRGDAYEGDPPPTPVPDSCKEKTFPAPKPASELQFSPGRQFLWHGLLSRGGITLFSALWKAGKTTLLAHLLRAMEEGGEFLGLSLQAAKVLYVSEESEDRWARRRDALGLKDHLHFLIRPFGAKPTRVEWTAFLGHLAQCQTDGGFDLTVLDPITNLWPVRDENDATQVVEALMPLHRLTQTGSGLMLVHHTRKGDGNEATASRGSGALTAFVDTIIELRRYTPNGADDGRRVLSCYGRDDETPREVVAELKEGAYEAQGDRQAVAAHEIELTLLQILPNTPPGFTFEELKEAWPKDSFCRKGKVLDVLHIGGDLGKWAQEGEGKRGSPYRWWVPPPVA